MDGEAGGFGEVLAQQAVGVLVAAALPRASAGRRSRPGRQWSRRSPDGAVILTASWSTGQRQPQMRGQSGRSAQRSGALTVWWSRRGPDGLSITYQNLCSTRVPMNDRLAVPTINIRLPPARHRAILDLGRGVSEIEIICGTCSGPVGPRRGFRWVRMWLASSRPGLCAAGRGPLAHITLRDRLSRIRISRLFGQRCA